jgi:hypothetical protein
MTIGLISWTGSTKTENFGLNFFTEILGVSITVLIIDRLMQKREEARSIPQKLAAYEDVRLYTSRYINFWTSAYRDSVPDEEPETIVSFFSDEGMTKIFKYLYLDSEPNVTPSRSWWEWINQNAKEFKDNGNKILDRYSYNLDPIAFGHMHQLTESLFNNMLLLLISIKQSDMQLNYPRIKVLGYYSITPQKEDFDAILGLVNWCNESYYKLKKYNHSIKKVSEYSKTKNRNMPPSCMIPDFVLEQQIKELNDFQHRK